MPRLIINELSFVDLAVSTMSDAELLGAHIDALFTCDAAGDLVRVNEPGGAVAPRFFLGWTRSGAVRRFRQDLDRETRIALDAALVAVGVDEHLLKGPVPSAVLKGILGRSAPVQRVWAGPAFRFPQMVPSAAAIAPITDEKVDLLRSHLPDWIPDVTSSQPLMALVADGRAVALCGSVRRTTIAHEAGVETAPAHRGRGYAGQVVAAWAAAVCELDRVPLYSTSWNNEASRVVARKLGLVHFASDLHIT